MNTVHLQEEAAADIKFKSTLCVGCQITATGGGTRNDSVTANSLLFLVKSAAVISAQKERTVCVFLTLITWYIRTSLL